ncbi:proline dehydrogenase [Catalinimonas alkaloidigena]|uniref:Proline dehydrogenase n=1 Tax=Catalinimonas alkaloidigena TaxID=1075417 RepID=A0A1G8X3K4_9BACT|nr:proline dehydrogenase family protein [Catalinimonas alkaloidigena]SDJ85044.1 proline dehydrogenase [Catalinimonas alkaloidigena]
MQNPLAQPEPALPAPPLSFDDTSIAFSSKSDRELRRTYWLFAAINQPWLTDLGTGILQRALRWHLPVKGLVKATIFDHFVGGETIADCEHTIQSLAQYGIGTILDYSVEGEKTEQGFEQTTRETIATIEKAATTPNLPFTVFKMTGVASFLLLKKKQAGEPLSAKEQEAWQRVEARVDRICRTAHANGVPVFIDGEETWIQDVIDEVAYAMMRKYNQERALVYNTFQLYTKAGLAKLRRAHHQAVMHHYYLGAKLVRGAYMEKERDRAERKGYPDPIQPSKEATDHDYHKGLLFCLNEKQRISLCAGTHNEYSCYYLAAAMEKHGIAPNDPRVWFAQLYGMGDNISYNLAHAGYNVAKYVPYGPVQAVIPYLIRRADENTSVAGQSSREFTLIQRELARRKAQA